MNRCTPDGRSITFPDVRTGMPQRTGSAGLQTESDRVARMQRTSFYVDTRLAQLTERGDADGALRAGVALGADIAHERTQAESAA